MSHAKTCYPSAFLSDGVSDSRKIFSAIVESPPLPSQMTFQCPPTIEEHWDSRLKSNRNQNKFQKAFVVFIFLKNCFLILFLLDINGTWLKFYLLCCPMQKNDFICKLCEVQSTIVSYQIDISSSAFVLHFWNDETSWEFWMSIAGFLTETGENLEATKSFISNTHCDDARERWKRPLHGLIIFEALI
jgi:hypothetical protein